MSLDLSKYNVILGSSSERRQAILKDVFKLDDFVIKKPDFEENLPKTMKPIDYVHQTAHHKLLSLLETTLDLPTILICCDTIVDCNGTILEKPSTKERQREMFSYYKAHPNIEVISSVHIAKITEKGTTVKNAEVITTMVFDDSLPDAIVDSYIESGEALGAAGGFKFQETGSILFKEIKGDFFNIVGLPAIKTFELLGELSSDI